MKIILTLKKVRTVYKGKITYRYPYSARVHVPGIMSKSSTSYNPNQAIQQALIKWLDDYWYKHKIQIMYTDFKLSEYVSVEVEYSIIEEEAFPRGPEEVGRERTYKVIEVDKLHGITFKPHFVAEGITLPVDFRNEDYRKRILAYIEKQMNKNADNYYE